MAYIQKTTTFKNAIEVSQYHTARYGAPGQKREKKKKPTPELMRKRNQYNRERTARWKLRANFDVRDYFSTLTYRVEERPPDMDQAKEDFAKAKRKIQTEYRKRGYEL